MARKT